MRLGVYSNGHRPRLQEFGVLGKIKDKEFSEFSFKDLGTPYNFGALGRVPICPCDNKGLNGHYHYAFVEINYSFRYSNLTVY